jgi:hypothetical protein
VFDTSFSRNTSLGLNGSTQAVTVAFGSYAEAASRAAASVS